MVGSRKTKIKKCPNCHRKIEVKGAKFCCFCGSDIREEKDIIIEKIQSLFGKLVLLPVDMRDEAQTIIHETIVYIKKGDNK